MLKVISVEEWLEKKAKWYNPLTWFGGKDIGSLTHSFKKKTNIDNPTSAFGSNLKSKDLQAKPLGKLNNKNLGVGIAGNTSGGKVYRMDKIDKEFGQGKYQGQKAGIE